MHPEKKKLISVITSNKAFTQGHIDRIRFVSKLKEHFGDQIDVFGRGYNTFGDKWDVLADYKYHIVIENSSQTYYWTEKLSDCFLAETYPFYYGCTNIADYFPSDAYTPIDISNPDEAIKIIDKAIKADAYGKSMVVDPWGNVIAKAGDRPCCVTAEIDLDYLDSVRAQVPSILNRREDVYSVSGSNIQVF